MYIRESGDRRKNLRGNLDGGGFSSARPKWKFHVQNQTPFPEHGENVLNQRLAGRGKRSPSWFNCCQEKKKYSIGENSDEGGTGGWGLLGDKRKNVKA